MNVSLPVPDFSCSICPYGTLVDNGLASLNITVIPNGGTCNSVASYALAGCFDDAHCSYLKDVYNDFCCVPFQSGAPIPVEGELLDVDNNVILPSPSCPIRNDNITTFPLLNDGTYCLGFGSQTEEHEMCLENVFEHLCFAVVDNYMCNSCDLGVPIEGCSDNENGILVDCSNGDPGLKFEICSDGMTRISPTTYCTDIGFSTYFGGRETRELCFDTCTLDGTECNSCESDVGLTKDNEYICHDELPGYHVDCSNVDARFDLEFCSNGEIEGLSEPEVKYDGSDKSSEIYETYKSSDYHEKYKSPYDDSGNLLIPVELFASLVGVIAALVFIIIRMRYGRKKNEEIQINPGLTPDRRSPSNRAQRERNYLELSPMVDDSVPSFS